MARYQIEWLPSDAIAPLDDEGAAPGDGEVELNTETQVAAAEDWSGAISQLLHELGCDDQPVDEVICALSPAGRWSVEAPDGRRAALVPLPEIEVELEPDAPSLLGRLLGPQGDATALPSPAHLAPRVGDHADAGRPGRDQHDVSHQADGEGQQEAIAADGLADDEQALGTDGHDEGEAGQQTGQENRHAATVG